MPGVVLAGIAAASWDAMWKLYDQRYGKYGEERCRVLEETIIHERATVRSLEKQVEELMCRLDIERRTSSGRFARWVKASDRANELAARLNEMMMRVEMVDLPPNPFDEVEEGVPEPTEMDEESTEETTEETDPA